MAKELYSAREAAQALGISLDTLRRWDRDGRIKTKRDAGNRRVVNAKEIQRLRGDGGTQSMSARNCFHGTVRGVKAEGLLAQVDILVTEPTHLVAIVTREAVEELGLKPGVAATGIVKSPSVMIER